MIQLQPFEYEGHLCSGVLCRARVTGGHRSGVLDVNGAHSTRDLAPLLVSISDDNGLFQTGDVGRKGMVNIGLTSDGHVRGFVTDVGKHQGGLVGGNHEGIVTIDISHGAVIGAFFDNRYARQGHSIIGVGHLSGDGRGLGKDSEWNQPTQEEQDSHSVLWYSVSVLLHYHFGSHLQAGSNADHVESVCLIVEVNLDLGHAFSKVVGRDQAAAHVAHFDACHAGEWSCSIWMMPQPQFTTWSEEILVKVLLVCKKFTVQVHQERPRYHRVHLFQQKELHNYLLQRYSSQMLTIVYN